MPQVGKSFAQPGANTGETTIWFTRSQMFPCNSAGKTIFNHNRRNSHARNVSGLSFHNSRRVLKLQMRCGEDFLLSVFRDVSFHMYLLQKKHFSHWKINFLKLWGKFPLSLTEKDLAWGYRRHAFEFHYNIKLLFNLHDSHSVTDNLDKDLNVKFFILSLPLIPIMWTNMPFKFQSLSWSEAVLCYGVGQKKENNLCSQRYKQEKIRSISCTSAMRVAFNLSDQWAPIPRLQITNMASKSPLVASNLSKTAFDQYYWAFSLIATPIPTITSMSRRRQNVRAETDGKLIAVLLCEQITQKCFLAECHRKQMRWSKWHKLHSHGTKDLLSWQKSQNWVLLCKIFHFYIFLSVENDPYNQHFQYNLVCKFLSFGKYSEITDILRPKVAFLQFFHYFFPRLYK